MTVKLFIKTAVETPISVLSFDSSANELTVKMKNNDSITVDVKEGSVEEITALLTEKNLVINSQGEIIKVEKLPEQKETGKASPVRSGPLSISNKAFSF